VAFSPDGGILVSGGIDGKITLWNLSNYTKIWTKDWKEGKVEYVREVAFAPNGLTVAACGWGSGAQIRIYSLASGSIKTEFGTTNPVGNAVYYSSDSKNIFVALTTYSDISKVSVVCRYAIPE
jgi:WD40 repeat protein